MDPIILTTLLRTILTGTTVLNTVETGDIYVTQVLDFVWGIVAVALKLFPNVLNFLVAPIEKTK